jgi:hypothetical protein
MKSSIMDMNRSPEKNMMPRPAGSTNRFNAESPGSLFLFSEVLQVTLTEQHFPCFLYA